MQQNQQNHSKSSRLLFAISAVLLPLIVAPNAIAASAATPIMIDWGNILVLSAMWCTWCFWWQLRLGRYQ